MRDLKKVIKTLQNHKTTQSQYIFIKILKLLK